jgi:hypothetical protein
MIIVRNTNYVVNKIYDFVLLVIEFEQKNEWPHFIGRTGDPKS